MKDTQSTTPPAIITSDEFAKSLGLDKFQLEKLATPIMKLLKIDDLNSVYEKSFTLSDVPFVDHALGLMNIKYEVSPEELENIPKTGGFIVIANHPYGGIDGMLMISLIRKIRPDFRVMANYLLQYIKPMEQCFIAVNPFENASNKQVNISGIKTVLEELKKGNGLGIFPAGEVSAFQTEEGKVLDKQWEPTVGKIIKKAKVPVIPMYFSGRNSTIFNLLGLIHPTLRTVKLPSELLNKEEETIKIRIAKPIKYDELEDFEDTNKMLKYLRTRTYALSSTVEEKSFLRKVLKFKSKPKPVVPPTPIEALEADISKLRNSRDLILTYNQFEIFVTDAESIPNVLREIGRLREITFRQVGEGTNRNIDLDEYDLHYHHLFLWDKEAKQIAGAYRIGRGNELYQRFGKKGFYLSELFKMEDGFIPTLRKSLEMGRSFIIDEYQRRPTSLFLLWKGVLLYLRNNPDYQYLIGPVSISNNFSSLSKELLVSFIKAHYWNEELAQYITPRKKFKPNIKSDEEELLRHIKDLKGLDNLIADIEFTHNKIPILLKKYLSQNARIIGFNIDPKFSDCLDGFIIMNLLTVPEDTIKMLDKYSTEK
jgi:putative hemolysin